MNRLPASAPARLCLGRRAMLTGAALLPLAAPRIGHAQAAKPIKVGVLCDMSGMYADDTGAGLVLATSLAVKDMGGSVLGRPVQVLSADDKNTPDIGTGIARRWLDEEGVDAIVCASASSITLAVADLARQRNKVLLIAGSLSTDLTGKMCGPTTFQFGVDTYASPKAILAGSVKSGLDTWFMIYVDYAFGRSLKEEGSIFIQKAGGKIIGNTSFPLNSSDLSSALLTAQASGAKGIGLACGGSDWTNLLKQAKEFGIGHNGQTMVSLASGFNEVAAAGLNNAQGMLLATPFYWDMDDDTRSFAKPFIAAHKGVAPNWQQSDGYSGTLHFLKAIKEANTSDGATVGRTMRAMKVNDPMMKDVSIRADGQVMRPIYMARVKAPEESKNPNDIFKITGTIAPEDAWRPAAESECKLLRPA